MSAEKERAVVQYFTDMAGIERLAAALFEEQRARAEDPVLASILATFVEDERRHARCAELLASHYDVRKLEVYRQNPELRAFGYHFVEAIRHVSAEVTTVYVTVGELMLDVALLRSIDSYVDDPMSSEVMERINRDESRHIAIDFHMTEYYAGDAYQAWLRRAPRKSFAEHVEAAWALSRVFHHARPFIRSTFLEPMERVDPTGRRIAEAFARYQGLIDRPAVRARPIPSLIHFAQWAASREETRVVADLMARVLGAPEQILVRPSNDAAVEGRRVVRRGEPTSTPRATERTSSSVRIDPRGSPTA